MPNKKITAMPSLGGNQVPTDLLTAVDLSAAPVNQNVKSTLNDLFSTITKNITDRAIRFQAPGSAPAVSATSQGALYHNGTSFQASSNGGAYEQIFTLSTQTAALVFAGPATGGPAVPSFRALALTDLPAGVGTVTSVGLSAPSILTVANSPVTGSGTLALSLSTQTAGLVFAGPATGGPAVPTFRALALTDLPAGVLTTTGTFSTGGTLGGVTVTLGSDATGDLYYRNSGGVLTRLGIGTSAQVLTVSGGGLPTWATSTATAAGSAGDYQINSAGAFAAGVLSQSAGRLTSTATAVTSGVVPYLRLITPADTGLTASTEAPGIVFGGDASGATVTRTRAAGAVTTQREFIFTAPTYAAASSTNITTAATVAITGAPVAGTNATLTNRYALLVESGSAANRFQNDTTAIGHQLDLYNANASGSAALRLMDSATTIGGSLVYNKSDNAVRIAYASGISGTRIFEIDNNLCFQVGNANTTTYAIGMGSTATAEAQLRIRSNPDAGQARRGLRIDHGVAAGGPTAGALEIRREVGGGVFDERYRFFLNTTESNARITDSHGGTQVQGTITENVTLSTVGATTDTTIQIPANSLVLGVTVRVTTGITGINSTALQFGDSTTAARFGSIAAFTAGTTGVGLAQLQGGISTDAAGPIVTSATAVRLTLSGGADNTPSAGAVRVTIHYISLTAPTS